MEAITKVWQHLTGHADTYIKGTLVVLLLMAIMAISGLRGTNESLQDAVAYQQEEATVWKDKFGRSHAENKVLQVDRETLQRLYGEELQKNFSFKPKNITSATTLGTSNMGATAISVASDRTFRYTGDNWSFYTGSIVGDTIFINHEVRDSLTFVTGYKKRLFKPDLYTVEVMSHNPSTTFTSLKKVEVREKVKRFGVGVGVYYTPAGVMVGAGLQYNIIRF